jgi:hypothetical protein
VVQNIFKYINEFLPTEIRILQIFIETNIRAITNDEMID